MVLYPLQGLGLWLSERAGQQLLIFPGHQGTGPGPGYGQDHCQGLGPGQGFGLGPGPTVREDPAWNWSQHGNAHVWGPSHPADASNFQGTNASGRTSASSAFAGPHSAYHGSTRTYFSPLSVPDPPGVWCPSAPAASRHISAQRDSTCTCNCRFGPRHNQQEVGLPAIGYCTHRRAT